MKAVNDMEILTDFLPDYIYPVLSDGAKVLAMVEDQVVGLQKGLRRRRNRCLFGLPSAG